MKKTVLSAIAMALGLNVLQAQTIPQWPEVTKEMKPGARWWWMGSAVDDDNLRWNIGQYAAAGIGTLEITPIYGVKGNESKNISYLSQGWMDALKTCQTTGDEKGMDIDMNGGTGWPFGGPWLKVEQTAGKLVTKNDTKTADGLQQITFDVKSPESNAPLNKVMAYQQDGEGTVVDVTEYVDGTTLKWTAPAGRWLLLAIYNGHTGQEVKRAAPGGVGKVLDHYDADAVAAYLKHFDDRFAATSSRWPHSFFNDSYEVYGADWTPKMFNEFEKYRGYKLEENMDKLLGLGNRKDTGLNILADYRRTLSDMLLNNFTRQWTEWAHGHGATTRNQSHGSPGNIIDFYAAVDIPEIEGFGILAKTLLHFFRLLLAARQNIEMHHLPKAVGKGEIDGEAALRLFLVGGLDHRVSGQDLGGPLRTGGGLDANGVGETALHFHSRADPLGRDAVLVLVRCNDEVLLFQLRQTFDIVKVIRGVIDERQLREHLLTHGSGQPVQDIEDQDLDVDFLSDESVVIQVQHLSAPAAGSFSGNPAQKELCGIDCY